MTPKREQFCLEYLVDLNATQAAIRAGYSPKTAGSQGEQLLKKVEIQQRIAELRADREQRTQIEGDRVIEELKRIGLARIDEAVECRGRTVKIKSFAELSPDVLAAIESVQQTKDGIKVKFHNKLAALEQLARHLGLFEKDNAQQSQLLLVAPVVRLSDDE